MGKSCKLVQSKYITPGWWCCQCNTYNGGHHKQCKHCNHPYCCSEEAMEESRQTFLASLTETATHEG